jgi:hypothetical protein
MCAMAHWTGKEWRVASDDRREKFRPGIRPTHSGKEVVQQDVLPSVPSDANSPFRVAEFTALREEILSHQDVQYQLVALAVIAGGTLTTVGLQGNAGFGAAALFIYPIFAVFLASTFREHGATIDRIAKYIREQLESQIRGNGWETQLFNERQQLYARPRKRRRDAKARIINFVRAPYRIFLGIELGTMILGVSRLAGVLIFNPLITTSSSQDLQAVNTFKFPLAVLLCLDLWASMQTYLLDVAEQKAKRRETTARAR